MIMLYLVLSIMTPPINIAELIVKKFIQEDHIRMRYVYNLIS